MSLKQRRLGSQGLVVSEEELQDGVLVTPEGVAEGHDQIASFYEGVFKGFPDLRMTVWHTVFCADPAVTKWMLTGTHNGPFMLPGGGVLDETGRPVAVRGTSTCSVGNDKIITHRIYYDQLELYSQLGGELVFDDRSSSAGEGRPSPGD